MRRMLIWGGILLLAAGLFWPWINQLGIGRLPGDIVVERPGFRLYLPFTTMVIISLVLSVILWLLKK